MLYNSLDLYTLDINKPNLAAIDNDTDYYTHTFVCTYFWKKICMSKRVDSMEDTRLKYNLFLQDEKKNKKQKNKRNF